MDVEKERWSNDDAVRSYYARDEERDRLAEGVGAVEFSRTVELVKRTLPAPSAIVADIGGGPGRYVDWLVDAGYQVVHRDIIPDHVRQVRQRHPSVDSEVADARTLTLADNSVDAVLLLGPLYHLITAEDRAACLAEAVRILRPGGRVYAAAISRSFLRAELALFKEPHPEQAVILDLLTAAEDSGLMPPMTGNSFNGFAHTVSGLAAELDAAGLQEVTVTAIEGVAFAMPDLGVKMADSENRTRILDALRRMETLPDIIGMSPHLLAVGTKLND